MDYARKVGKPARNSWSKRDLGDRMPQKRCDPRRPSTPFQEDRRLANWKRWLADRERRQRYLAAALKREPIDLALNAHERVRLRNETKCLVEAAGRTELTNQDKYRGNPAFWRAEERLRTEKRELCADDDDDDDYYNSDDVIASKSRHDRFLPPEVTRVALPAYIKKEKALIQSCADPSKIDLKSNWDCGEYLKHRRTQLRREIKYLEPKHPETEDLIIVGRNCQSVTAANETPTRVPVITITPDETKRHLLSDPDDRAALKIQEREFVLESSRHFEKLSVERTQRLRANGDDLNAKKYVYAPFDCGERVYEILPRKCKSAAWSLHFHSRDGEICERNFCLENRGVRVVHAEWRRATHGVLPIALPERVDSRFFFDKSRISVLPGQKVEVPMWFRASRALVATETWQLVVDPKVYPGPLLLRLWAVASGENDKLERRRQYDDVKALLRRGVRDATIREIIDDLIANATTENIHRDDDVPYEMYFLESELFQARNPGYFYKSRLVNELKDIMHEEALEHDWDLTLRSLKSVLLKIEDPPRRRERLARFQAICRECLLPDFCYARPRPSRERHVYTLLCMFVNRFEDEDDYVMRCCCRQSDDVMENEEEVEERFDVGEMDEDGQSQVFITRRSLEVYGEAMFVRIYCRLRETIDKICLAVESCDFFDK